MVVCRNFGSSRITGARGFDLEEEEVRVAVTIGDPLHHFDPVVDSLDDAAFVEYEQIQIRALAAHQAIAHRFPFFGPYLPCWCGSGKKMK